MKSDLIKKIKETPIKEWMLPVGIVAVVFGLSTLNVILNEPTNWTIVDSQADLYHSMRLCELDWAKGCKYDAQSGKYIGPYYRGQTHKAGKVIYMANRPRTSDNSFDTTTVFGGAYCYRDLSRGSKVSEEGEKCRNMR